MTQISNLGLSSRAKSKHQEEVNDKVGELGRIYVKRISWNTFVSEVIRLCEQSGIPVKHDTINAEDGDLVVSKRFLDDSDWMPGLIFRIFSKRENTGKSYSVGVSSINETVSKVCKLHVFPFIDHSAVKTWITYETQSSKSRSKKTTREWIGPFLYDSPLHEAEKNHHIDGSSVVGKPSSFFYSLCMQTASNVAELIEQLSKTKDIASKEFSSKKVTEQRMFKLIESNIDSRFVPRDIGGDLVQEYRFSDSVVEGKTYRGINLDLNENEMRLGLNKRAKTIHDNTSASDVAEEIGALDADSFFYFCAKVFDPSKDDRILQSKRGRDIEDPFSYLGSTSGKRPSWLYWVVRFKIDGSDETSIMYIRVTTPGVLEFPALKKTYYINKPYFSAYVDTFGVSMSNFYCIGALKDFVNCLIDNHNSLADFVIPIKEFAMLHEMTYDNLMLVRDFFDKISSGKEIDFDYDREIERAASLAKSLEVVSESGSKMMNVGLNKRAKEEHNKKTAEDTAVEIGEMSFEEFFCEARERFEGLSKRYNGGAVRWFPNEIDPNKRELTKDESWISVSFKGIGRFVMVLKSKFQRYPKYKGLLEETFRLYYNYTTSIAKNSFAETLVRYFGNGDHVEDPDDHQNWYFRMDLKNLNEAISWMERSIDGSSNDSRLVQMESFTSLGLNKRAKEQIRSIDAIDNVSQISFEDPEVERICHEHGVYTYGDAREVTSIREWFFRNSEIKSFNELKYFTGLKEITNSAFYECKTLKEIIIPDNITSIGTCAFCRCYSLQSINIHDGVTNIGDGAFAHCRLLTSVIIPDGVKNIGGSAFWWCMNLQEVNIPYGVTSIGEAIFECCKSLQAITIPDNVTYIGSRAFEHCDSLQSVIIPVSVEDIGIHAFSKCTSLQEVTIQDGVGTIDSEAFSKCSALRAITIPPSVTSIGEQAFSGCSNLETVIIQGGEKSVEWGAFNDCKPTIYVSKSSPTYRYLKNAYIGINVCDLSEINEAVVSLGLNKRAKDAHQSKSGEDIAEEMSFLSPDEFLEMAKERFDSSEMFFTTSIEEKASWDDKWFSAVPRGLGGMDRVFVLVEKVSKDHPVACCYYNIDGQGIYYPFGNVIKIHQWARVNNRKFKSTECFLFGEHKSLLPHVIDDFLSFAMRPHEIGVKAAKEWFDTSWATEHSEPMLVNESAFALGLNKRAKGLHDSKTAEDEAEEIGNLSPEEFGNAVKDALPPSFTSYIEDEDISLSVPCLMISKKRNLRSSVSIVDGKVALYPDGFCAKWDSYDGNDPVYKSKDHEPIDQRYFAPLYKYAYNEVQGLVRFFIAELEKENEEYGE